MLESLTKKPFKERLKDTGFLLKNSFTVMGKDKDIKTPTIKIVVLSSLITTLIFACLFAFVLKKFVLIALIVLLFTLLVLTPFKFFYYVRQKADQSWIVYNTITGKDISYQQAHEHTSTEKSNLRFIAFVDMLMGYSVSKNGKGKGVQAIVMSIFLSALNEIWDLISHYMLPAVVIEEKPLKEIIPQLKELKNNIPATLVGVFGIDFAGFALQSLLAPIYILAFIVSIGIGYMTSSLTPEAVFSVGSYSFSWIPILIGLYIIFLVSGIIGRIIDSIKVIYFTIFYTALTRPKEITPEIRSEITNYLLMKEN